MDSKRYAHKGKFIIFEGLDGSGITEQADLLRDWLRRSGFDLNCIAFTHEPSEGPVGLMLNLVMQGRLDMDEEAIALLFAADRRDHLSRFIQPRLDNGIHVVSERYYLSFYAYQAGQGLSMQWLRTIGQTWRSPDLVIVLDTPLEQCMGNIDKRFAKARYENRKTLANTWDEFQRLIRVLQRDGEHISVVDGSGDGLQVHNQVLSLVAPLLTEETG